MDEVDGNSRDTSTDGSSGSFSHSHPELPPSKYEALPRHHSSWSQPTGEMTHNQQLRGHISWSERADVDRTWFNYDPTVASGVFNQFASQLAQNENEVSCPAYVKHDEKRTHGKNFSTNFPAGGGEDTKLPEMSLASCQQSPAESQSGFLFREDEPSFLQSSEACQPRPDSGNGLTFELRSDLNSQNDKDLGQILPESESAESMLSLRHGILPPEQLDLREHLPKPDPTSLREANADRNARMQGTAACGQLSMTGSFVQQCSDINDYEYYGQVYGECYEGLGNSLPIEMRQGYNGVGHLERVIQTQDDLLRSRDQEILQLKEANHRQSLFIEKVLNEKRLLEATVVEQARLLMSNGAQRSNTGPVVGSAGTFDSQLYEAQLATYKEDFENERKEKLLIKGSADSLKDQLQTVVNELRTVQDKLKKADDELDRMRNPYRTAYQPYLQTSSNHSNSAASSSSSWSSQSAAAAGQNKTPLYRKQAELEPDRVNQTIVTAPTQMEHLNQMTIRHEAKVTQSNSTRPDQPCRTPSELFRPNHPCQKNQSGNSKRPHGQEYQVNQIEMKNSGLVNHIEEMCITRPGPCDWIMAF